MAHMNTHDEAWTAVLTRIERALSRPRLGDALARLDALAPPPPLLRKHTDFASRMEGTPRAA
ncbi:MAG: hypothetical protein AB7T37_04475 [Dehalococcoidia bacterium]